MWLSLSDHPVLVPHSVAKKPCSKVCTYSTPWHSYKQWIFIDNLGAKFYWSSTPLLNYFSVCVFMYVCSRVTWHMWQYSSLCAAVCFLLLSHSLSFFLFLLTLSFSTSTPHLLTPSHSSLLHTSPPIHLSLTSLHSHSTLLSTLTPQCLCLLWRQRPFQCGTKHWLLEWETEWPYKVRTFTTTTTTHTLYCTVLYKQYLHNSCVCKHFKLNLMFSLPFPSASLLLRISVHIGYFHYYYHYYQWNHDSYFLILLHTVL